MAIPPFSLVWPERHRLCALTEGKYLAKMAEKKVKKWK
jgi:hypothetical protein